MRKHTFRPSLNDVLEDRLALSHTGSAGVVHVAHPKPHNPGMPVLKSATLGDVNRKIDLAFATFNTAYSKEITRLAHTGDRPGSRATSPPARPSSRAPWTSKRPESRRQPPWPQRSTLGSTASSRT